MLRFIKTNRDYNFSTYRYVTIFVQNVFWGKIIRVRLTAHINKKYFTHFGGFIIMTTFVKDLNRDTEMIKAGRGKVVNTLVCFGKF